MFFGNGAQMVGALDYERLRSILFTAVDTVDTDFRSELDKAAQANGNVSNVQMLRLQSMIQRWQLVNESSSAIIKSFGDTLKGILQRF